MSTAELRTTFFHDWHVAHSGRMVEFGGWDMPVQYSTIVEEHLAVRSAAGLFDIAHMGRLRFSGPDTVAFLDHVVTNHVASMKTGQVRYALVTNESGGVLDDVLVYRFDDHCVLVVNASNREKIVAWLEQHRSGFDVEMQDCTLSHGMLAVQGPQAAAIMATLDCTDAANLKYYTAAGMNCLGRNTLVSRTGYTGEDGFEIIMEQPDALDLWTTIVDRGADFGLRPCGLGCRDTLRLEAAMPLYGHELLESIDPLTAGLQFAVKLDAKDFIGRDALVAIRDAGIERNRVGLQLEGRRIAREGATIHVGETQIGEVTSGTFSPTLEESIAMGYVSRDQSEPGTAVEIDIRGKRGNATVVPLPFYKRR